jgi:hypothetical protein
LTRPGRRGYSIEVEQQAGLTQLVECQLPKLDVASSNLVSRSEIHRPPFRGVRAGGRLIAHAVLTCLASATS